MKVSLVVVQGKPEGKVIPLQVPRFKIGRAEGCQLRPNSEQVSREHAEFVLGAGVITVRDLGSRNGTLVNGQKIGGVVALKEGDLVQVGPLTFAVNIEGAPAAAPAPAKAPAAPAAAQAPAAAPAPAKPAAPAAPAPAPAPAAAAKPPVSLDDAPDTEIERWLLADEQHVVPETKSGVYSGQTMSFSSFNAIAEAAANQAAKDAEDSAPPEDEASENYEEPEPFEEEEEEEEEDAQPEEWVDESNPFHVKKSDSKAPQSSAKPEAAKDSSAAAQDILKRMMERRRSAK